MDLSLLFTYLIVFNCVVYASHFRGGTISWRPTGNGNEVEFNLQLGWQYGTYACKDYPRYTCITPRPVLIGSLVCISGCAGTLPVDPFYYCSGLSSAQKWERTEDTFTYIFPSQGPFQIAHQGGDWIGAVGGSWSIVTTVDLRVRSDTGNINNSPVATYKPIFFAQNGCVGQIRIGTTDKDNDLISCRWAKGTTECSSICHGNRANSFVTVDETTCTFTVSASSPVGIYALAIMVEDKPRKTITVGGQKFTPNDVLSSVPLQFILEIQKQSTRKCSDVPVFIYPTPDSNARLTYTTGEDLIFSLYATSPGASITEFLVLDAPTAMRQTLSIGNDDLSRPGVYKTELHWKPAAADEGVKVVCIETTDNNTMSARHCISLFIWDVYECASNPCENNGTCFDLVNGYYCMCVPGYTDAQCLKDINECASSPCQNGATCFDLVNEFFCGCANGYTDVTCSTDIDECAVQPCLNGGSCLDLVGASQCVCKPGFTGTICQSGIDSCASLPCGRNGVCENKGVDGYLCQCDDGWLGTNCQYRFENDTFFLANKTALTSDYMHYSDCECAVGNRRQELCYSYTIGKHAGWGILSVLLGILTSCLLYCISVHAFDKLRDCGKTHVALSDIHDEKELGSFANDGHDFVKSKTIKELASPKRRHHHCWACDVKYNNAEPPVFYSRERRMYKF